MLKKYPKNLKYSHSLITLYNILVKSVLISASQVWGTNTERVSFEFEKVQNYFLWFLSFKINIIFNKFRHDYTDILKKFKLLTLQKLESSMK